jgi:hypothetical protein
VEGVGGGLHEENPERGILTEQRGNEVLVAAPDVVPRFEGHQHDVAHWATILVLRLSDRASMHPGCRQVTALLA